MRGEGVREKREKERERERERERGGGPGTKPHCTQWCHNIASLNSIQHLRIVGLNGTLHVVSLTLLHSYL